MAVFLNFGTWVSVFFTSAVGKLLFLENLQLIKEMQQKEIYEQLISERAAKTFQSEKNKLKTEICTLRARLILTKKSNQSF